MKSRMMKEKEASGVFRLVSCATPLMGSFSLLVSHHPQHCWLADVMHRLHWLFSLYTSVCTLIALPAVLIEGEKLPCDFPQRLSVPPPPPCRWSLGRRLGWCNTAVTLQAQAAYSSLHQHFTAVCRLFLTASVHSSSAVIFIIIIIISRTYCACCVLMLMPPAASLLPFLFSVSRLRTDGGAPPILMSTRARERECI